MHCVTACILGMVQWVQWVCCYLQSCRHDWLPFVAVLSYHAPCWFWGGKDTPLSGLPIWAGEYKALLAESWYERDSAGFDGTLTLNLSILWRECKSISEIGLVDGCIVVCFYASLLLCCVTAVQPWQMARHGTNRYQRARWTISRRTLHVSGCWRCEKSGPRSSWDHPFNPPWICSQQPFFCSALGRTFHGFHHGWAKVTAAMEMVLHSKVWSMYIWWNLLGDLFRLMSVASIWLLKTMTERFSDRCRICWELLKWFRR